VAKVCKPGDWYTAREVAELLEGEVTEATVKDYCKRGDLKAKKLDPRSGGWFSGLQFNSFEKTGR